MSESSIIGLDVSKLDLVTLDKNQIKKITDRLPILEKDSYLVGHSTSQTSYSLQTLQMISDSPLSRMKQCTSQINKKYGSLRGAYFKIEYKKLEIKKLQFTNTNESILKIRELESEIKATNPAMENTLREIGMFQDMYDAIKKNNNISDDWTEEDFEKQEISHMIKSSFRLGIQDLSSSGRVSHAVVEYWEQLGIHPQMGEKRVREYLIKIQEIINKTGEITIQPMYDFLDEMGKEFSESHKLALKRTGLDEIGSEEFMAKGVTKPT
mgnify:CR=1 FL=1